ncbi:hypothetical protein PTI98_004166 [Pleurotus ostreatus]|nr:hypothetical protein PTI98_004166 [Pleurotus ostreatus]
MVEVGLITKARVLVGLQFACREVLYLSRSSAVQDERESRYGIMGRGEKRKENGNSSEAVIRHKVKSTWVWPSDSFALTLYTLQPELRVYQALRVRPQRAGQFLEAEY